MRVVSLCPSLTATVFALGRGDTLVGRTRFCVLPRPAVDAIEAVGGTKDPSIERVLELAPDVVLMNAEENRREDAEAFVAAGIRVHDSLPRSPADVPALLRALALVLDARAAGEAQAQALEQQLHAVRTKLREPSCSFVFLIWRAPWMVAGPDTYASALLEACGGRNALPSDERYPTVRLDEVAAADPQRVLLTSEPFRFRRRHVEEVVAATGLSRARVLLVDGQALTWHGAHTRIGLEEAQRVLARKLGNEGDPVE